MIYLMICIIVTIIDKMSYLASLDQSTTSTKFSLYHLNGQLVEQTILQHKQYTPTQGWLQHHPIQIIDSVHQTILQTVQKIKIINSKFDVAQILALGVTNQRQTIVCWNPQGGKPYYNAIVWCDTRCKSICQNFTKKHGDHFRARTGLPVSTYFSFFKIRWLIQNVPQIKLAVEQDRIRFGTIDTWVVYNLTGKYVTDASNASRTYMCDLKTGQWDKELVDLAGLKKHMLPQIVDSFSSVGIIQKGQLKGVQIRSILGDQQSSAYAHELKINQAKITYGTGCFLLANIGSKPVIHSSFITTIMYKHKQTIQYGYEIAIECGAGTINWAKREGFFHTFDDLNNLKHIPNQKLYFFPSFGQIYAPFWKTGVQGGLLGINLSTEKNHIVSSILESIIFRVYDNIRLESCKDITVIFADGGITKNQNLMQKQCDLLNKKLVHRQRDTCWGVAKGVLTSLQKQFNGFQSEPKVYEPNSVVHEQLVKRYSEWAEQRRRYYGWKQQ